MKLHSYIAALLVAAFFMSYSCNKNNRDAEKLNGNWNLNKWSYAGKDTIPPKEITNKDSLGTWIFYSCRAHRVTCDGEVSSFMGSTKTNFGWYIREKATQFTMAAENPATSPQFNQISGEWNIIELSTTKLSLSSSNCASCSTLGAQTLEFSR
jgi:hypothetical protein